MKQLIRMSHNFLWLLLLLPQAVSAQINCPPNLPLTLTGNTEYCVGSPGSELSVAENYDMYEWLPTAQLGQSVLLTAGNYDLVVTHYTGCTDTLSFEVAQVSNPPQPTIVANGPTEFCEGESVTLSGPAGYPYYEWSSGSVSESITIYESGIFVISIEDWIGCTSSSNSLEVIVNPYPTAAFSPSVNMFDAAFNNLSLDANTYEWNFGDGNTSTDFEPTHTYNIGGTAEMYLVAENDCGTDTAFLNLQSVDIGDDETITDLSVYPNPSNGFVNIKFHSFSATEAYISLEDISGKQVFHQAISVSAGSNQFSLDLFDQPAGLYSVEFNLGDAGYNSRLVILPN